MQLTGTQFTKTSAVFGNDISTVPDIPAEIRAPQGSLPGVSAFQVSFSSYDIYTPGDTPDVLVAMNPAALKVHLPDLPKGGIVIVNTDEFNETNLKKAGYDVQPARRTAASTPTASSRLPIGTLNARALADTGLSAQEIDRSKNMFALGLMFWMYSRPLDTTIKYIEERFGRRNPKVAEANIKTLKAGYNYGETTEMFAQHYHVPKAKLAPGLYRNITGNEATALGFLTASKLAGRPLFYGSYPITPASDVLHELASFKRFGVKTFQAEDEIAAIGSAIGASFGGSLGMTGTCGPGIALKSEAHRPGRDGRAAAGHHRRAALRPEHRHPDQDGAGRPAAVHVRTQQRRAGRHRRAGHVLGLLRHGDRGMAHRDQVPHARDLPLRPLPRRRLRALAHPRHRVAAQDGAQLRHRPGDLPGRTSATRRRWRGPGPSPARPDSSTASAASRRPTSPATSTTTAENHDLMTRLRFEKIAAHRQRHPGRSRSSATTSGDLLVLGWGSTYGVNRTAVQRARTARQEGLAGAPAHLNPFPKNLGDVLRRFKKVLIPENNLGQLSLLIRGKFLVDAVGLHRVTGRPFTISEVEAKILEHASTKREA